MGGWVFLAIIIGIAVISGISRMLKDAEPEPQPRRRKGAPRPKVDADAEKDKFLAEIERLRKKAAAPKPVPTVKPKAAPPSRKPLRLEELPKAEVVQKTVIKDAPKPAATPGKTVADVAKIADISRPQSAGSASAAKMASESLTMGNNAETPFSKDLLAMLKDKKSMPMAVILHEIFSPPKSMR